MVEEQARKILKYCKERGVEFYEDEYITSKLVTLLIANNIREYNINVYRTKTDIKIVLFFNNNYIVDDWEIRE